MAEFESQAIFALDESTDNRVDGFVLGFEIPWV